MLGFKHYAASMVTALALVGCASPDANENAGRLTAEAPTNTELAAYAASHPYPSTQPTETVNVAAIASPDRSSIKLYNFTNRSFQDAKVWVNGGWLFHVQGLPANGSVVLNTSDLYNAIGKSFASQKEPISRVQIETPHGFYNALGPVSQ